jgi:hypothetical protein
MEDVFSRALHEASEAHKSLELEKATRDAEARPVMVRYTDTWYMPDMLETVHCLEVDLVQQNEKRT